MEFKVVTWNVNSITMRINHLIEFIKQHDPDVICLQEFVPILDHEINEDIIDYDEIKKINFKYINQEMAKLGYKYSCIGECIKNNFTINEPKYYYMLCNATYSKLPIEKEKIFHLFINRNIIGVQIKFNNNNVWILNTHLAYFPDKTPLNLNKDTIVLQFETLKQIIQKEFDDKNIIFCGDFNINLYKKGPSYRYKNYEKVKNITDLFNNTSKVIIPTNFSQNDQTDFILLSKSSDIKSTFNLIYNSDLSDHNPVFSDFV
jgi:exonuclease III